MLLIYYYIYYDSYITKKEDYIIKYEIIKWN